MMIKAFVLFFLGALLLPSNAYYEHTFLCSNASSSYTSNSTYELNLKTLLRSLPSNVVSGDGFYIGTAGNSPDEVYGLAFCRGDLSPKACANCTAGGFSKVFSQCSGGKSATLWLDVCLVRYSDANFSGTVSDDFMMLYNVNNASDVALYDRQWGRLMNNLSDTATTINSKRLYAVGEITYTDYLKIYGMVQCTRDLSPDDCDRCLSKLIANVGESVMNGKIGGWVIGPSCFLAFENSRFYSTSSVSVSPPAAQPALVSPPPPPSPSSRDKWAFYTVNESRRSKNNFIAIISIVVPLATLICVVSVFLLKRKWADKRSKPKNLLEDGEIESNEFLIFDLDDIKAATNNFSDENKLGQGGYGPVYKGTLPDGRVVAVKRLSSYSGQGAKEFKNEVQLVVKLQHRNLVRLLGCCLENGEKTLIYEFVPNNSLDKLLFNSLGEVHLDWVKRTKIIVGIARGLVYLHHDSVLKIIHRDLKASNILLDMDMNPKISDFGLSKLVQMDQTHGSASRIAGTYGYMAPEYVSEGRFSVKSDVFSFGVLMLEIVTDRKNASSVPQEGAQNLLTYAWKLWRKSRAMELIDEAIGQPCETSEALRCIHIGLLCVQVDSADRPTMSSVLIMLSSPSVTLPAPSAPAFFLASKVFSEERDSNGETLNEEKQPWTASDISSSALDGR